MPVGAERQAGLYAIRLLLPAPCGPDAALTGRVEHVLSGRCHDFDSGPALLAFLQLELQVLGGTGPHTAPAAG